MTISGRDKMIISGIAAFGTLALYYVFFGRRHMDERSKLSNDLDQASDMIRRLQDKIDEIEARRASLPPNREIRIWMDGAFDMMHYGHMNAFRQAKSLGTFLVVGVNSSESITKCKGPPVMDDEERIATVGGCKFVDAVEPECPYIMNDEYLMHIIEKWNIDYVVHGDDPCIVDGKDVYESAQKIGKYKTIPRTEGVSTTEIVGRMLLMQKSHLNLTKKESEPSLLRGATNPNIMEGFQRRSNFLTTNRMLRLFSAGTKDPEPGAKIVYVDGGWDMFHAGHIKILELARQHGDYVIVGVHNDAVVNQQFGSNYPILNMQERVLSVLGCKFADDVLIDAPWDISRELIASLNVSVVISGTQGDSHVMLSSKDEKRYSVPIELGIYKRIESPSNLNVVEIVSRIHEHEERFRQKFEKKIKAEQEYYDNRYQHVPKVDQ